MTQVALDTTEEALRVSELAVERGLDDLRHMQSAAETSSSHLQYYKNTYRVAKRKASRAQVTKEVLRRELDHMRCVVIPAVCAEAMQTTSTTVDNLRTEIDAAHAIDTARFVTALAEKASAMDQLLETLAVNRKSIRNLKQRCYRAPQIRMKALAKAKSMALRASVKTLKAKGTYTPKTRSLVRALVHSGCSTSHVGAVMRRIARAFGVRTTGKLRLDKRTVGRINLEGGIASEVQIAHEITNAESQY